MRIGNYKIVANMLPQHETSIRDARPPQGVSIMDFIRESELGNFSLYDLAADPSETKDLAESRPEMLEELRCGMIRLHAEIREEGPRYELGPKTP